MTEAVGHRGGRARASGRIYVASNYFGYACNATLYENLNYDRMLKVRVLRIAFAASRVIVLQMDMLARPVGPCARAKNGQSDFETGTWKAAL